MSEGEEQLNVGGFESGADEAVGSGVEHAAEEMFIEFDVINGLKGFPRRDEFDGDVDEIGIGDGLLNFFIDGVGIEQVGDAVAMITVALSDFEIFSVLFA